MARLTIVGTGIKSIAQLTLEAVDHIRASELLLYLVAEPLTEHWLRKQNPAATSMVDCYQEGHNRMEAYREMIRRMLDACEKYETVCVAFYGHPGVFAFPTHEAIRQARARGHEATMLAGVSAADCLYADLGVDPAEHGCQDFEATDFLLKRRRFDPNVSLILWQVALIGQSEYRTRGWSPAPAAVLVEYLSDFYPLDHQVALYHASEYAICPSKTIWLPLAELPNRPMSAGSTLYVPPVRVAEADLEMARRILAKVPGRAEAMKSV
jgi:uncharacterized protein YabN with tetrapyrrole methylase and pyrophosphatase domain